MSRRIENVASVRFEIQARQASASMEALQGKADDLNHEIDAVKRSILDLGDVNPEHEGLKEYNRQLADLDKKLKDVKTTMKDYTRGVKAADELLRVAGLGQMETLSMKAIKAGQNGLKKRIENIQPDTLNPEELKSYRIIKQVIEEADNVVNKFKTDAAQAIQTLRDGGTVSERAMKQARDGVKALMESYEEGSKENREFAEQYEFLAAKVIEFAEAQRRAAGEIVNADDARRAAVRLTKEGVEAARQEVQAQDAIIAQQKEQIRQNEQLRQTQQQAIDQTQQQIKANQQEEDSIRAKIRTAEDEGFYIGKNGELIRNDIHGRVNALEKEKDATRETAEQQQAAAQVAQNAANQKREAFEQTTQAVTQLDGEVKQLKADLEKMNQQQAPKENPVLEGLKKEAEVAETAIKNLEERLKQLRSADREKAPTAQSAIGYTVGYGGKGGGSAAVQKALQEQLSDAWLNEDETTIRAFLKAGGFTGVYDRDSRQRHAAVSKKDMMERYTEYLANRWGGYNVDDDSFDFVSGGKLHDTDELEAIDEKERKKFLEMSWEKQKAWVERVIKKQWGEIDAILYSGADDATAYVGKGDASVAGLRKVMNAEMWKKGVGEDGFSTAEVEAAEKLVQETNALIQADDELLKTEHLLEVAKKAKLEIDEKIAAAQQQTTAANQAETKSLEELNKELERTKSYRQVEEDNIGRNQGYYDQSAASDEEKAKKQELLSQKEDELAQKKTLQTQQEKEYQQAQAEADSKQQQANDTQAKAISLQEQHTQATNEANAADKEREQRLGELDQKANKLNADNEQLNATLHQQEAQQQATDRAIADGNQTILDAEKKKAQARELSAKDMRDAIAALQQENDAIGESNPKWAENNRLIGQYSQRLEEMKQKSAELRGEIMSLDEALAMSKNLDEGASVEQMEQAVKTLTEARRKATDQEKFDEYGVALDKISAKLKEQTSEWMTLAQAREIAEQAGKNYYNSGESEGFTASPEEIQKATAALERQREALIKSIKAKRDNKNATEEEKAALKKQEDELQDLTKKLKDLKFEQDNFNMSQAKMQMLMKQPTEAVSLDELRAAIKRADGELKRMEGSLGANSKQYKEFAAEVKNAKNQLKEMEGQAKATSSAWDKAWSRLKTYVGMYMGFNMLWQKMTGTMDDMMTLSDKMGEVRKTTGFTADEVGRLSDNLAKMDTRTNLTGLMEFSSLAGSIGLKTQEAVQGFTEAANMIAVSLPEMGNEASRTLMKIADATGDLEKNGGNVRETLERVGSTIIALRANSAAAAGPITDFVSRVGAVGAQAGISIDQIAALGATVDALGGRVEMSATALSRMIPAIKNNSFAVAQAIGITEKELKGKTGMEQMVAIFRALHDSVKGFDTSTEEGMNAMADSVEKALGRSTSMQDVMKELNQQGARAGIVFGLLSQNVDKLEEQLYTASEAYKENTALLNEYNKMNETTAAKWEKLKNQLEEAFVSDHWQRTIGNIIDWLRGLVNLLTEDGPIGSFFRWSLVYLGLFKAKWAEAIGGALLAIGKYIIALRTTTAATQEAATATTWATTSTISYGTAAEGAAKKTNIFSKAWGKLSATMKANLITAVAIALIYLYNAITDAIKATKEAAAEISKFNQQIADEQKALNKLFDPLNKSNLAQKERAELIKEINSQYGKYLGYMISETSSAIALADAHALIAKRIREEAYERRIAEKEKVIQEAHGEKVNAAYADLESAVRDGVKGGVDVQEVTDILKGVIDSRLNEITLSEYSTNIIDKALGKLWGTPDYVASGKIVKSIDGSIERLVLDGKLSRDDVGAIRGALFNYAIEAKVQHNDIMGQTANLRSDLRGIQGAIKVDLANNLNTLVSKVASTVGNAVNNIRKQQQQQQQQSPYLQRPQSGLPSLFGGGQQGGGTSWQLPWQQQRQTTPEQQMAPKGWKPNIDKKDTEAVRQFVQDQEALRGALQASGEQIDEAQRRVAESWLLTDAELKEYKDIVKKADRAGGGGGGGTNPYGDYNDRVDPYEQWDPNALVARRKEMLERVRALAGGADVQAVLSEDKRFMDEATRKGIKNMRDAIAWYNEERLKIEAELDTRNLTPTGDWKNPEKGSKSKRKPKTPESEGAIAELDRYYSERKELIEEARSKEQMTEAEYNRRLDALEQEHLTKRSELRQTFTSEDKKFIQQFRQWWASVKDLDEVSWTAIEAEWIAAWERDRKYNNREAQKDLTAMQAILVKQLKEIEAIIDKERPFNGIATNLQDNLTKMGILFKDGVEGSMEENTKRLTFLLKESENAYTMTWEQLAEDMRKNGLGSWADAIASSENADKEKRALIAQLHTVYDAVQDAIKKEAAQVKKQVDIAWNDAILPNGKSIKQTYEQAISAMGIEQGRVSRANSLIGAGQASERVADKLAIKQMQLQLRMQEHYYNLIRKTGLQRIEDLKREAEEKRKLKQYDEAERLELDAKHATMSLNLSLSKEQTELDKQREDIIARTEESQARLYKELREWGDLIASSLQSVFEASNAGNAEYYNELAKLNLTGKGGPGAGTYIVIDNEGTEDATAHYEYLDERQALERQREIEQQNAQAEAWKKVMDDINMKLSDTITDQLNAMLQNQSIDANTQAVIKNTEALLAATAAMGGNANGNVNGNVNGNGNGTTNEGGLNGNGNVNGNGNANGNGNGNGNGTTNEGGGTSPFLPGQEGGFTFAYEQQAAAAEASAERQVAAIDKVKVALDDQFHKQVQQTKSTNNTMVNSTQSTFAKMTAAANLYGIAYQAMSNDNLDMAQKFEMFALQAAGQAAIGMLTTNLFQEQANNMVRMPGILGKLLGEMPYPAAMATYAAVTALIGGLMGLAVSQVSKSKSQIAAVTGASVGAGRLSTGMLTYAEGNVNEFTDPASLTPGRQYNVDAADGKTYRARYMGANPKTHLTNGPEFHLVGEKGREAIIDAHTTRLLQTDDTGIWKSIQMLYNGGSLRHASVRRGRGVRAFASGNLDEIENLVGSDGIAADGAGFGGEQMAAFQSSLDRNNELLERALTDGIHARFDVYGKGGLIDSYDTGKKTVKRHGERY